MLPRSQQSPVRGEVPHGGPLAGEVFSREQVAALGRLLHAWGSGNGLWCHDEAHRTRHHRFHD